jgi:hypothetical protein
MPPTDLAIGVREPVGDDELFLLETSLTPAAAIAALAQRVVSIGGNAPDWNQVAAVQLGAVALGIRRAWIGDRILSDTRCPQPECGERVDVSFSATTYLAHHRPRRLRNAATDDDGWYRLLGRGVRFRIPTVADLLATIESAEPTAELATRCIEPKGMPAGAARAVDRALSALAPSLEDLVGGNCPECEASITLRFDPVAYTFAELRNAFADIYRETHTLASAYGWSEEVILRQPRSRRRRYAAMVFDDRSSQRLARLGAA